LVPSSILAQSKGLKEQLPGAWALVAVIGERPDGSKFEPFGANPKGIIIFTSDGHFSLFQSSADVPRIALNDRAKATPEEATAVVRESIAYYGTYSVNEDEKTLSVRLDGSTYANLVGGPEQKRIVTSLTPEELRFTNPRTPAGVTLLTVWKRAKAP
jgi:Lipocalin-like domain